MYSLTIPFTLLSLAASELVKWIPRTSFNMPMNFEGGKLPCSGQTVVFPEFTSPIDVEADVNVSGLVLPNDGEINFNSATVYFGDDPKDNCSDNDYIQYLQKAATWNQPDVWSSTKFNKATPDAERIPCFDDVVEFPPMSVQCQLPDQTQFIQRLKLISNDQTITDFNSNIDLYFLLSDQFILNKRFDIGLRLTHKTCGIIAGCPCQEHPLKIDCSVKFCPSANCVTPIQPIGHCCKICGGALVFDISQSFDLMAFKRLVNRTLESYSGLIYYISRITNKVQLVVVEEGDYDGTSSEAVNEVNYQMTKDWVDNERQTLLSGSPMYKYGLGGKLFVSMFFVVIFVMGTVYGYYYKLPDIRYPIMGRGWFNVGALARFQRRSESIVSLTRRDSVASGIRNPLYDSRRGRVLVTESVVQD